MRRPKAVAPARFPGLVVRARAKHPIPSRTRPLSAAAPMVLRPKTRESRSPPNLKSARTRRPPLRSPHATIPAAGWSSPVARQAHNLKVVGSNPTPATKISNRISSLPQRPGAPLRGVAIRVRTVSDRGASGRFSGCPIGSCSASALSSPETTAQVHPAQFTRALMRVATLQRAELRLCRVPRGAAR
jgi:hypothetical protein